MEGYKYLATYILATVIHDLTIIFCTRYIDKNHGQPTRCNKRRVRENKILPKDIVSKSRKLYQAPWCISLFIKELTIDYEDYLRQHNLSIWFKNDPRIRIFRDFRAVWRFPNIPNTPNLPNNPESASNMLLTFCQMETCMLINQIDALKRKFSLEGGFRENLFKKI